MLSNLDALFREVNGYKLTARIPVAIKGHNLKGKNELPLISQSVANAVATVAWAISSPKGQQNIQQTIERSVNRKFMPFINAMARSNKNSFHHLYEWDKAGVTSARLFDLKIPQSSRGKANFSMKVSFRPSKTLVPLTTAQSTPNPITGAVVQRKHIFYNKAMVMEYGLQVIVRPKSAKNLAFDSTSTTNITESGLVFTSKPIMIDYKARPTYHALQTTISTFFSGYGGKEISDGVRNYSRAATVGARKASHLIKVSVPSDAYANSIAKKITEGLFV